MNKTVPGVRLPIMASFTDAIMIDIIEQKRKKFSIEVFLKGLMNLIDKQGQLNTLAFTFE